MSNTVHPDNTRPTPTIEDYLILIYVMERDGEDAIAARLSELLDVSPPTVTTTLKRMERDEWIVYKGRKGARLTLSGREAARSVIRRHMLIEWMLVRMLNVPISQTHTEAHRIEHTISADIEERIRENLGDPKLCPHGNPLPGYESLTSSWLPFTQLQVGDQGIVRRIHELAEDRADLIEFLYQNDIVPGTPVKVTEVLPSNQTVTVEARGQQVTLGSIIARYVFVEKQDSAPIP